MVFVFGALIEYAFVNVSVRMEKKRENKDKDGEALLAAVESDAVGWISDFIYCFITLMLNILT